MCRQPDPSSPTITAIEVDLPDPAATVALARTLATRLAVGDILRLEGDLGAGKTELARALIRHVAHAEIEVPSPTFTLAQHYPLATLAILHVDLYRIGDPDEVLELGIGEALSDGCVLVEWPEKADDLLPATGLRITLRHGGGTARTARLEALDPIWTGHLTDGLAEPPPEASTR